MNPRRSLLTTLLAIAIGLQPVQLTTGSVPQAAAKTRLAIKKSRVTQTKARPRSERPVVRSMPGSLPLLPVAISVRQPDGKLRRLNPPAKGALAPLTTGVATFEAAAQIAKFPEQALAESLRAQLSTSLLAGVTGLLVVDASTGEQLISLRADQLMNPASHVKLLSTATALDLLGPDHQFVTTIWGPAPNSQGVVTGDITLVGSYDPTLFLQHITDFAAALQSKGVVRIDGQILMQDNLRDGVTYSTMPVQMTATTRNQPAAIALWPGDTTTIVVNRTKTVAKGKRNKTNLRVSQSVAADGQWTLAVDGTIVVGDVVSRSVNCSQRQAFAAHWLRHELAVRGIASVGAGIVAAPVQWAATQAPPRMIALAQRTSATVAELVAKINKRSVNWLADRLIMVAAGYQNGEPPSMKAALAAMQTWAGTHAGIDASNFSVDTGSGLSYRTKLSPRQLVDIIRGASGFGATANASNYSDVWQQSLAIAGKDGTLAHRFLSSEFTDDRLIGKTGTLSNVVALAGILRANPERPLVFALITNGHPPRFKNAIRAAHQQVISTLIAYVANKDGVVFAPTSNLPASDDVSVTIEDVESDAEPIN